MVVKCHVVLTICWKSLSARHPASCIVNSYSSTTGYISQHNGVFSTRAIPHGSSILITTDLDRPPRSILFDHSSRPAIPSIDNPTRPPQSLLPFSFAICPVPVTSPGQRYHILSHREPKRSIPIIDPRSRFMVVNPFFLPKQTPRGSIYRSIHSVERW